MKFYYIATIPNAEGEFEVHERDCDLIPVPYDRNYLGPFNTSQEALRRGQSQNELATVCPMCGSDNSIAYFSNSGMSSE